MSGRTLTALAVALAISTALTPNVSPAEAQAIARDAYVYSYAMMESYQTWRTQAVDKTANGYVGGFNVFRHYSEPFTPDNKDIVTPNNDTPYSWAWLDLRAEPMVVSVPTVPKDRYYVMQWIDLFTQNFAYIGVRSTGFDVGNYIIACPKWKGKKPAGIRQVFKAETDIVGTLTRTALQGPDDVPNVKAMAGRPIQAAAAEQLPQAASAACGVARFYRLSEFPAAIRRASGSERSCHPQALRKDRNRPKQAVGRLEGRSRDSCRHRCRRKGGTGGD
jgi:hypothetical protein